MLKKIVKFSDTLMDKSNSSEDNIKRFSLAFASGAVEGFFEGLIIAGSFATICDICSVFKKLSKK